jgi:DNA gyrase subunit A
MGRSTQGVTLIALSEGEKLAGVERILERDEEGNGGNGNGNGSGDGSGAEPGIDPASTPDAGPQGPTIH